MRDIVVRFVKDESGFVMVKSALITSAFLFVVLAAAKIVCAKVSVSGPTLQSVLGYIRIGRIAWDASSAKLHDCFRHSERYYVGDPTRNVEFCCGAI